MSSNLSRMILSECIREVSSFLAPTDSDGEVTTKFRAKPKHKPPRRRSPVRNKSNRTDYMKNYMRDYRNDKGKDYQKMPDNLKKLRREQKKRLEDV